jgi:small redox-active disulfide protein 2
MKIEILGTGCPKCERLAENAQQAVSDLGLNAEIVKVRDINDIIGRGVMMTPALAVNGEVRSVGKVLSVGEIRDLLS